eukprot:snap_masked-scaffold_13-processed-gene-10.40-mRNA-1 protein AED:0.90 eAED:0.91 QI:0/0/0/0.66/1/1/3/0/589
MRRTHQDFEAEKIIGIKLTATRRPEYQVLIKWLGFEDTKNSWHPLKEVYNRIPNLIRRYINGGSDLTAFEKEAILHNLWKWDKEEQEEKGKNKTKRKKKSIRAKRLHLLQNKQAPRTRGWLIEEKEVLKSAIQLLGCGMYSSYMERNILPYRSKQQIYTQIQKQLNIQSIGFLHGLKIDVDKVRLYLDEYWGSKEYKVRKPGVTIEKQEYEQLRNHISRNIGEFTGTYQKVLYYRRLFDIDHLKLILEEHETEEQTKFLKVNNLTKEMLKVKVNAKCNQLLKDLNDLHVNIVSFRKGEPHLGSVTKKTYRCSEGSVQVQDLDTLKLKIKPKNEEETDFCYEGGNKFKTFIENQEITIFYEPLNSRPILGDAFNFRFPGLKKSPNRFKVIVLDPPWNAGVKNPTRGIALDYPTLAVQQIAAMTFPVKNYPYGSYLLLWTVNMAFVECLEWMESQQFYLVDYIPWIKKFPSGKHRHSMGHYLTHCKELCLVFQRKTSRDLQYSDVFNDENRKSCSVPIITQPLDNSCKPQELYSMLEHTFPWANAVELFARSNNLRSRWTSIGIDLLPMVDMRYIYQLEKDLLEEEGMSVQ